MAKTSSFKLQHVCEPCDRKEVCDCPVKGIDAVKVDTGKLYNEQEGSLGVPKPTCDGLCQAERRFWCAHVP
jgi:hypothetical protein